jgi:hypothetical protein
MDNNDTSDFNIVYYYDKGEIYKQSGEKVTVKDLALMDKYNGSLNISIETLYTFNICYLRQCLYNKAQTYLTNIN